MTQKAEQAEPRKVNTCKRCGWQWFPRKGTVIACPKCHSPYWDKERQK